MKLTRIDFNMGATLPLSAGDLRSQLNPEIICRRHSRPPSAFR